VKQPGGKVENYRKAVRYSEETCQFDGNNGDFLNTLGVAYYRTGNYQKAFYVLVSSGEINSLVPKPPRLRIWLSLR
jgi:hypothetical protein